MAMSFEGAIFKETCAEIALVKVRNNYTGDKKEIDKTIGMYQTIFSGMPAILMAEEVNGKLRCIGREDIPKFLADMTTSKIPWKKFTIN